VELASYVPGLGTGTVAITTISGGGCAVLADLAADAGLPLRPFSASVQERLRAAIPGSAPIGNPVDLTGLATDDQSVIAGALRATDAEAGLHMFAVNTPLAATEEDRELYRTMVATVTRTAPGLRAPVALFTLTSGALDPVILAAAHDAGIPLLQGAREALVAVSRLRAAAARRLASAPSPDATPVPGTSGRADPAGVTPRAAAALAELARHAGDTLTQGIAGEILAAAGLNVIRGRLAATPEDAAQIAGELGFPVVAKIESPDIPHKSDAGCVRLDLRSADEVRAAAAVIGDRAAALGARIDGVRIERQAPDGIAVLAGAIIDPQIGPAVVVGAGGIYTELLDDAAVLLAPATAAEVREALAGLRIGALLSGARGQPAADIGALAGAVAAISEFAWAARDEITALDVNPILVHVGGAGVTVVDALLVRRNLKGASS